jgi:undecaprenyl-diphosphatase
VAVGAVLAVAAVVASMILLDGWAANRAPRLPAALIEASRHFTEFGKSGWFLWPIGIVLAAMAIFDTPATPRFSRLILAALAVRLGYVFTAIAVPGLVVNILKRVIGRARPFVAGNDTWAYTPFGWQAAYASLPSGHTTTAFSALVAIGALFPRVRALMWVYAILIALSRVVVSAHYPSDVLAGAVVGAVGAFAVRNWFAARQLAFRVGCNGSVTAMPGPGVRRIVKAVARWRWSE